jgi:serine/threonine-protein kinase
MNVGQIIKDRYKILELLGEGGMAFVYKAEDRQLKRMVAIKTLKPNYVQQETFVERFKREAQTVANLNHPNIVQIFDWGIEDEPFFVMEYIEGNTLTSIIAKRRQLASVIFCLLVHKSLMDYKLLIIEVLYTEILNRVTS